ncbi:MAG: hypothetical protein Q8S73_13240 [Deltaproteobacteria bacterium]|nr:hypothetical protein [Myxococcales bacterium]MDP3215065.1 hypothetical protein [Deltaproteobacteria bacterium]
MDEFATVTTWGRFQQACLYWVQGALYEATFARMDREWSAITPALRTAGLERPLRVTLQEYGWLLLEQVHAIVDRGVRRGDPVVLWCDPWPDAVALRAIAAARWLERESYARAPKSRRGTPCGRPKRRSTAAARDSPSDGCWGEATHTSAGLS